MILPSHCYTRSAETVASEREQFILRRIGSCNGCKHLTALYDGHEIHTACARGKKVGRKGKCTLYREVE